MSRWDVSGLLDLAVCGSKNLRNFQKFHQTCHRFVEVSRSCSSSTAKLHNESWKLLKVVSRSIGRSPGVPDFWHGPKRPPRGWLQESSFDFESHLFLFKFLGLSVGKGTADLWDQSASRKCFPYESSFHSVFLLFGIFPWDVNKLWSEPTDKLVPSSSSTFIWSVAQLWLLMFATLPFRYWRDAACCISVLSKSLFFLGF